MAFTPDTSISTPPAWFFSLETDHVVLGTGVFEYPRADLEVWRMCVGGADGAALQREIDKLKGSGIRINEPELHRPPRGYGADHPRAELLRRKGLSAWIDYPDEAVALGGGAVDNCMKGFRRLKPVFDWLMDLSASQ